MKISQNIMNNLMDILSVIGVCANGHYPETEKEMMEITNYARAECLFILDKWAKHMNEDWVVVTE